MFQLSDDPLGKFLRGVEELLRVPHEAIRFLNIRIRGESGIDRHDRNEVMAVVEKEKEMRTPAVRDASPVPISMG